MSDKELTREEYEERKRVRDVKMAKDGMHLCCAHIMQQTSAYLAGDIIEDQAEIDKIKAIRQKIKSFCKAIKNLPESRDDLEFLVEQSNLLRDIRHALHISILDSIPDDLYTKVQNLQESK